MELKLNEKYKITTIPYNFVLQEKIKTKKEGSKNEFYYNNLGYFGKLEDLFIYIINKGLLESDSSDMSSLITYIEDLKGSISKMVKDIDKQLKALIKGDMEVSKDEMGESNEQETKETEGETDQ